MSQFLELQRSRLEEIDTIKRATFKRLRKNPELIPAKIRQKDDILSSKLKRPHKETVLQKHEIKQFKERYDTQVAGVCKVSSDLVQESLDKITDTNEDFQYFDSLLEDIKTNSVENPYHQHESLGFLYSMYSSSPTNEVLHNKNGKIKVKRRFVLSEEAGRRVNMNELFSSEESFGKFLNLLNLHEKYNQLTGKKISYIEYLRSFGDVPYEGIPTDSEEYKQYIIELADYLVGFYERTNPLQEALEISESISQSFQAQLGSKEENNNDDGKPNENGEVYCKACDKTFNKETVYKGHLEGKKHKKNSKKLGEPTTGESKPLDTAKFNEFKVKYMIDLLKSVVADTIDNVERQDAMTEREKIIEQSELAGEESEYTTADSEPSDDSNAEASDEDDDREIFKQLPTGLDGAPIPFWLYKLQGLHHTYSCEICGNIEYKGRVAFEKHFGSLKHQQGLKFLGVDNASMKLFANIININEALELWEVLKKQQKLQAGEVENSVEVEDKEGNVMTEADYIELKKQGML